MNVALPLLNFEREDETAEAVDLRKGQKSDSAYRTISEVATDLNVPQHVLRFWETKFKQISPLKRGGGRRYYRPQDTDLIKRIHYLLYTQGYTIKGVQKLLAKDRLLKQSVPHLADDGSASIAVGDFLPPQQASNESTATAAPARATDLSVLLDRLKDLRSQIDEEK